MSDADCGAVHMLDDCWAISDCKYAALKASHAELVEAVSHFVKIYDRRMRSGAKGQMVSDRDREPAEVANARIALAKAEALK